jgi:protein-S-isoprenylcysteine O-methyltransferase Ste14
MSTEGRSDNPDRIRIPRWVGVLWWVSIGPLVHGIGPWALSSLARRAGWIEGHPSTPNLLGLAPLIAGAACITWCAYLHLSAAGESFNIEATPRYLLTRGPYRYSRNPIYICVFAIWVGWSVFYGSLPVMCALTAGVLIITILIVPFEERRLQAHFGETYGAYRRAVPRFMRPKPDGQTRRQACV